MAKILVTGGLGYIGSHTSVVLLENGYEVVIVDNLSNSSINVLDRIEKISGKRPHFLQLDVSNEENVAAVFDAHPDIKGIIHFAAFKAVGESVDLPLKYYRNNIHSLVFLLEEIKKRGLSNFIFSSSCTVYGEADELPIKESTPRKPAESPYGNTKTIGEDIIRDTVKTGDLNAISLRYFNPIGAHPSGLIGELPIGVPQNLVPYISQTAAGIRKELSVFGSDYNTLDGTAIRDYIHVMDLAEAHMVALERIIHQKQKEAYEVFNLGTGKGSTVLEVIQAFEKATQQKVPYQITERRKGDVEAAWADTSKAKLELKWETKLSLEEALRDAWKWETTLKK